MKIIYLNLNDFDLRKTKIQRTMNGWINKVKTGVFGLETYRDRQFYLNPQLIVHRNFNSKYLNTSRPNLKTCSSIQNWKRTYYNQTWESYFWKKNKLCPDISTIVTKTSADVCKECLSSSGFDPAIPIGKARPSLSETGPELHNTCFNYDSFPISYWTSCAFNFRPHSSSKCAIES